MTHFKVADNNSIITATILQMTEHLEEDFKDYVEITEDNWLHIQVNDESVPMSYKHPIWNGSEVINDDVKEAEEAQAKKLAEVKTFIDGYIQAPIDAYNLANGVDFANAHSCADYKDVDGYTHQQFCIDIWAFNVDVWEKARQVQIDVAAGAIPEPTMEEFVAMLPVYGE